MIIVSMIFESIHRLVVVYNNYWYSWSILGAKINTKTSWYTKMLVDLFLNN